MLSMLASHPSNMRYSSSASDMGPFFAYEVNGNPMIVDSAFWDSITFRAPPMNRRTYDLPRAEKPRSFVLPSWQSLASLNTVGDAVLDPSELPERQLSPIGSQRAAHRAPPRALAPVPQRTQARPLPKPPTVAQAQVNRTIHELPARPLSAPPRIQRIARAPVQEVEKIEEVPEPLETVQVGQTTATGKAEHLSSECQGDPLCATHRKRPARKTGPHKRRPFQLYEGRPQFGYVAPLTFYFCRVSMSELTRVGYSSIQCNDFDCTGRNCRDCAYLLNRGGSLRVQVARPMIEDKLKAIDEDSAYAEDTLTLLHLRATFQVRRLML
ncbi:hypothetical protein TRAPUB_4397 [Trametes pubescens]|uniref:Uncharacterized protein n=1 Tax=Trametes pubescens TaxID=154538 RepID=A0A1M2VBA6_TRAPU|nr:hypothetical protein TRAPUB_4397 [Trametes pubescens]